MKRDTEEPYYGIENCETCGEQLISFMADVGYAETICPTCDNKECEQEREQG